MKRKKNRATWIFAAVIIVAAIAVFTSTRLYGSKGETARLQEGAPKQAETPKQEAVPEDLKGFTEYMVKKELGSQTSNYKDRIRSIDIKESQGKSDVTVELNGNDGFTKEMTVRGMLMDCKRLFKQLSQREDINKVTVTEYLEVEDIDGSLMDEWAYTLTMDKSNMDRFIEENLPLNDITGLAEEYKLHPNLK